MDGNPSLIKSYKAEADVLKHRILGYGSSEGQVITNPTQKFVFAGVADKLGGSLGYNMDVVKEDISEVILGGTVAYGDELISDANGAAIALADGVPGQVAMVIGIAQEAGTVGAIIRFHVMPYLTRVLGESDILITDTTLTSAQILALNATPVQVLAAPGAGKAYIPVGCTAFYDYESAAYAEVAAGEDLVLSYTDASGASLWKFETTGFLDQTADQVRYASPTQSGDTNLTPVANAAVFAHLLTGEIITGDSPLKLRMAYRIINTAW